MIHIGFVPDGSVVQFKNSASYFLKVCDSCGSGGVVKMDSGKFIPARKIWEELGCELYVNVIADSLDNFYRRIYMEEFY